jgi:RNA polymerase sigma factor (TIGR02999 family)
MSKSWSNIPAAEGWTLRGAMDPSPGEITQLLVELRTGSLDAQTRLVPLVYKQLHRLAAHYMKRERAGHTLQPTALVNEAYVRLISQEAVNWRDRAHFFGVAARLMRNILVDHARTRQAGKRGGHAEKLPLDEAFEVSPQRSQELVDLDDALRSLEQLDPQQGRIVELRFFGGLSVEETAEVLDISTRTVKRDWSMARAWLHDALTKRSP